MRFKDMLQTRARRRDIYSQPDFWNGKAREFTGSAVSMWRNMRLNELYEREQFCFIDASLPNDLENLTILDAGCGTGRLARYLARKGAQVDAFDFASDTIEIARSTSVDLDITYRVSSIFDLNDHERFDAVVALGNVTVACKTPIEAEQAFGLFYQALKPGGLLILIEPFHSGFLRRVLSMPQHAVIESLDRVGFTFIRQRQLHFWPARIPLSLANWPNWFTSLVYYTGQTVLRIGAKSTSLGDYKGIVSRKEV